MCLHNQYCTTESKITNICLFILESQSIKKISNGTSIIFRQEKQEMTMMRTERDDLTKQVTFLRDQLSQAENSKTQADDQLTRLTSELEEVKAELKLSSHSRRE